MEKACWSIEVDVFSDKEDSNCEVCSLIGRDMGADFTEHKESHSMINYKGNFQAGGKVPLCGCWWLITPY